MDSLEGADDAADKLLLQLNTTPSTHNFAAGCSGGAGGPEDFSLIRCDETGDGSCPQANTNHCLVELPGVPPVGMPECVLPGVNLICIECDAGVCFDNSFAVLEFRFIDGDGPGMDCFFTGSVLDTQCNLCTVGLPRFKVAP